MATPSFYNEQDQNIYDNVSKFMPQSKYLRSAPTFTAPTTEEEEITETFGIPNTNAFTNSGGNSFSSAGNAFGYGSQIEPGGSYGSYDSINYTGGLPGNVQQYGIGRQFEDPSASPTGETYSYKKEVPGFMRIAGGFIPGGNFLLNLAEKRMNANRDQPPGNYRIGGLDESMKGYYDNLAGSGMLFDGPGGVKTLTGKNFTGKGYLEGQMELAKGFGFDTMTEEEIEDAIAAEAARHGKKHKGNKGFKYKQMLEASQMYKTGKAQKEKTSIALDKKLAAENEAAANRGRVEAYTGQPMSDYRQSRPRSEQNYTGGDTNSNPSTPGAQDSFSNKSGMGRTGYFFGGRVNYKAGGRTDAESQYGADSAGSYDSSQNKSGRQQSYGGDNNNDGGNNPPPTFYNNGVQVITDRSKFGFNYPTGLTKNLGVGQLTAILDARKSLEEEEPEGMIQYDSSVGPFDTRTTYDTTTGPEFNATYSNNNLNANYNTKTGLGVNYSKDIGPGTFTAGGTYNPDGTYNTEAKYGISFANGGLAGLI